MLLVSCLLSALPAWREGRELIPPPPSLYHAPSDASLRESVATVKTGFKGRTGNKGAVLTRFALDDTSFVFGASAAKRAKRAEPEGLRGLRGVETWR